MNIIEGRKHFQHQNKNLGVYLVHQLDTLSCISSGSFGPVNLRKNSHTYELIDYSNDCLNSWIAEDQ